MLVLELLQSKIRCLSSNSGGRWIWRKMPNSAGAGHCGMRDMLHSVDSAVTAVTFSRGAGSSASSSNALMTKCWLEDTWKTSSDCGGRSIEQHYPDSLFHLIGILWGINNCGLGLLVRCFKLSHVNFCMDFLVYTPPLYLLIKSLKAGLKKKQRKKIFLCIVSCFYLKSLSPCGLGINTKASWFCRFSSGLAP